MHLCTLHMNVRSIKRITGVAGKCVRNKISLNLGNVVKITTRGKTTFTPRRAILYVPGYDKRKIEKIPSLNADCVVLDIEDGVAINKKDEARNLISEVTKNVDFGFSEYAVRINSVESGLAETDLLAVFSAKRLPSTIMVPKVDSIQHIQWICNNLKSLCKENNVKETLNLVFFIESAQALLDLKSICENSIKLLSGSQFDLKGLVFGSDDFCADIGATRSVDGTELLTARQMLIIVAKAFKLQAIDMVHIDYKDLDGLRKYSNVGAAMGFTGKQVIHPSQIEIVQSAFSPSKEKIEWATELIRLFAEHQSHGKGAFSFRGSMIDKPLLLQAEYIVELAERFKL